jgi:hypothetical protein
MKKAKRIAGVAAFTAILIFTLTAATCGGGSGFVLTDIPREYNGKYALLVGVNVSSPSTAYVGYQSFSLKGKNTLCRISNGRVIIPVWIVDSSAKIKRYSGDDNLFVVAVSVFDTKTQSKEKTVDPLAMAMFSSVKFAKGSVVQSWKDGKASGEDPALDMIFNMMKGAFRNL